MDNHDIESWFREPNDDAYTKTEERTGPPLEYVSEKIENSLKSLHRAIFSIRAEEADTGATILSMLSYAFKSQLVAYLALMNMLALVNESDFDDRILNMSQDEFDDWIGRIRQQGSVTGE